MRIVRVQSENYFVHGSALMAILTSALVVLHVLFFFFVCLSPVSLTVKEQVSEGGLVPLSVERRLGHPSQASLQPLLQYHAAQGILHVVHAKRPLQRGDRVPNRLEESTPRGFPHQRRLSQSGFDVPTGNPCRVPAIAEQKKEQENPKGFL